MTAAQDTLFPLPEPTRLPDMTWEQRMELFADIAKARGGLIPVPALPSVLGTSRQRVAQLVSEQRLERVVYYGQHFVTGRSLREFLASERKRGRPQQRPSIWKGIVLGAHVGVAMAEILDPQE